MDVSGGILATGYLGYPCRHDAEIHFHPLWALRRIMNHSVVKSLYAYGSQLTIRLQRVAAGISTNC